MNRDLIEQVKRQLRDQSEQLGSLQGPDVPLSVLDTCTMLLRSIRSDIEDAPAEDISDFFYAFLPIAECVSSFCRAAEPKMGPGRDERLAAGTKEELERLQRKADDQRQELAARAASLEEVQAELLKQEEQKRQLDEWKADLDSRAEACTKEKRDALEAENNNRKSVIEQNEKRLGDLKKESKSLEAQLEAQDRELEQFPESLVSLRKQFKAKEAEIEELKNARNNYSPENFARQEEEFGRLKREVERLRNRDKGLKEGTDRLLAERAELVDRFPELEESALTAARDLIGKLAPQIEGKLQEVTDLRGTADKLEANLTACNELRRKYSGWLRAVETPLESMMRTVSEPESETLRETLDPAMCRSIRRQLDQAHADLKDLDRILDRLTAAYRKDVVRVQKEAASRDSKA